MPTFNKSSLALSIVILVAFLGIYHPALGQKKPRPSSTKTGTTAKPQAAKPAAAKAADAPLNLTDVVNAERIKHIYQGQFPRIKMTNYDAYGGMLMYVKVYSDVCSKYLTPPNRVELTHIENTYDDEITTYLNGRGLPIGSVTNRRLRESRLVGSGIFAEPRFEASHRVATGKIASMLASQTLGAFTGKGPVDTDSLIKYLITNGDDFYLLLKQNGCTSGQTKLFSENYYRYFNGSDSVQKERGDPSPAELECRKKLPLLIPSMRASSCACIIREMGSDRKGDTPQLEDNFEKMFLVLATSKAGLIDRIRNCDRP